ncbi:enoyl-CoA hydratase/isomerase family protein [Wenxinia marina]|uniref:Enoyl-CoA hydratase/carnithine racemase n=1 Tax=Wenxinia marina DSM 24838 TaxID=1123501 RepID=A0A0D0NJ05_9RHOB|nr:enoyl-CoA hydratase/isomerase family protein [Wenxinia marina]KIQ68310.1 Enoyl-CoA hydratase/carnithine racemase [Wenxinia marina DSM 24838]GGL79649.1 hypothetical protein GCM10011392_37600 [Wenxinia marina]
MSDVRIEAEGGILRIALDRPDAGNALTPDMATEIAARLADLPAETRVVVMSAAGADFCTGRASVMPPKGTQMTAVDLRALISEPVLDFYAALRSVPVPVIARVQGKAAGVGCALAALADVAIAGRSATFVVPEMNHDIAPTLVMDALADRVGRATLARMVLTRDAVSADEAKAIGLIGKVADDAALDETVEAAAAGLAGNSVAVVRAVKAFLIRAPEASLATRKELAALLNSVATAERFR